MGGSFSPTVKDCPSPQQSVTLPAASEALGKGSPEETRLGCPWLGAGPGTGSEGLKLGYITGLQGRVM